MTERIKFQFPPHDEPDGVEEDIALALFSAECVHGRPKTRLDAGYLVSEDGRSCVIEVRGPAGEMALRVFLGLCSARFGDGNFQMKRADAEADVTGRTQ